ncbi:hypothetical protein P9186_08150, partial [Bacillus safensis]|nr:hypothetical protein [Bacillus safensis]
EEFRQERDKLRMIAKSTDLCGGDKQKITKEFQNYVNRELKEDELETHCLLCKWLLNNCGN